MSSLDEPNLANVLTRSVENDSSASPPPDYDTIKGAIKGKGKGKILEAIKTEAITIKDDARSTSAVQPEQTKSEASTFMMGSPVTGLSRPYSRSSSPAEENYGSFRPPVNDSKGYYANAKYRHEHGSSPPPQGRRVASNHPSSPLYVPRNDRRESTSTMPPRDLFHGYSTGRQQNVVDRLRAAPREHTGREDDDMEIDDTMQPPRTLLPSARPSAHKTFVFPTASPESAGPRGRTSQRKTIGGRSKHPLPDPYVGVDTEMTSYDDEEDGSGYGSQEEPRYPRKTLSSVHRRVSQSSQDLSRYRGDVDVDEEEFGRGRFSQTPRSELTIETDEERFERGRHSQTPFRRRENSVETEDGNPLFLSAGSRRVGSSNYGTAPGSSEYGTTRQTFTHDTFIQDTPSPSPAPGSKKRKLSDKSRFNNPGANLAPSRYSGDPNLNWGLNQDPPSVPQTEVSDAALYKRGLTRGAKEKVCKRGYGANDPENVNIVNMKEDGMAFPEIVEKLNEIRVASGRNPSLSVCGVTSRYNRTAPLLFAAEGRQFIPLSKRGKGGDVLADGPLAEKQVWNDELDLILAQVAKEVDKEKWGRVAQEFNRRTRKNISAATAAQRHTLL